MYVYGCAFVCVCVHTLRIQKCHQPIPSLPPHLPILHPPPQAFHANKRLREVDAMLLRLYNPILWRCALAFVVTVCVSFWWWCVFFACTNIYGHHHTEPTSQHTHHPSTPPHTAPCKWPTPWCARRRRASWWMPSPSRSRPWVRWLTFLACFAFDIYIY